MIISLLCLRKILLGKEIYSEPISSDDEPSDERTMIADSDSSEAAVFEETTIGWDVNPKGIEVTLHQIVASLKNAAEGYLALASHMGYVAPYELSQVIAQIPPPWMYHYLYGRLY